MKSKNHPRKITNAKENGYFKCLVDKCNNLFKSTYVGASGLCRTHHNKVFWCEECDSLGAKKRSDAMFLCEKCNDARRLWS